jgi:DNA-binding transcriptional ArsR family regulator
MNVRNPAGGKSPVVEIEYGLAYEFLMTLIVFFEKKGYDYELDREWFDAARAKATPDLLKTIQTFGGGITSNCNHVWHQLVGLVYDSTPPRDVPAFLAHLREIEPLELRLHLLGYYQRSFRRTTPLDVILRAAEGDQEAQRQFLKTSFPDDGDWQELLRHLLSVDPETTKTTLLAVLESWYERVFRDLEPRLIPILERDVEAKRALKPTMTAERFIETATNGLEYVPAPGFRKVLLIPSYINRPWNEPCEYQDMKIFCYPVADENVAEDSNVPPVRLVRLYKALADERRLRILKLLMTKSYSLQELADEFGVARTTMHHHLGTLRTAGLVRIQADEHIYSLRQNTLSDVSELLDIYLKEKSQ